MSVSTKTADENYIKTFLRIKPIYNNDQMETNYLKISENRKCLNLSISQENESKFHFEKIFNEKESQSNIFETIGKPLCCNILEVINSTFISYGKKDTGKTYTILGKSIHEIQKELLINGNSTEELYNKYLKNKGLYNLCLEYIFNSIYINEEYNIFEFSVVMSFIEIFDNFVFDYFNILNFDNKNQFNLENLFNNNNPSNWNLNKFKISSPDEAFVLLSKAEKIRKLLFNEMNFSGNSGNIIITIYLEKINRKEKRSIKSDFNFIEISSNFSLKNNKYNISVNKTLETFSYIINQLSDNVKRENIIYENSILTNIIKESLGGNAKTFVLVNISPYNINKLDSFQSISLVAKMKNIKNNPKVNEIISENIDYSYYIGIVDKKERLKSEKNYLLNYLANLNINILDKNIENASKRMILNQNNKEKEEILKTLSDDINETNLKKEKIENDIKIMNKEKGKNTDKYNKINLSLFIKNKEIDEQISNVNNCINSKKE